MPDFDNDEKETNSGTHQAGICHIKAEYNSMFSIQINKLINTMEFKAISRTNASLEYLLNRNDSIIYN